MISLATTRLLRRMRELPQFRTADGLDGLSQLAGQDLPFSECEKLLGSYENTSGSKEGLVLVTDLGLHWWTTDTWQSLRYSKMVEVEWPSKVKMEAQELPIRTDSGDLVRVPISGGTDVTRDVFSFMTLVMRMIEDVKPTPCPYCGKPLASAQAKQCPHCFMDWHDLANPRSLKGD